MDFLLKIKVKIITFFIFLCILCFENNFKVASLQTLQTVPNFLRNISDFCRTVNIQKCIGNFGEYWFRQTRDKNRQKRQSENRRSVFKGLKATEGRDTLIKEQIFKLTGI